jgi:HlyD family secretion protein
MTDAPSTIVDGMSADAAITVSVAKSVLAVPIAAVISENGKKYVDVVAVDMTKKTMTTTKTEVKTGTEGDEYIEITSGLKAGDRVLRKADTTVTTTTSTTSSNTRGSGAGFLGGFTGGDRVRPDDGGATPPSGNAGGSSSGGTGAAPGGD